METFEIHITGSRDIIGHLRNLGLKSLEVQLLDKEAGVLKTEYMSSIVQKFDALPTAIKYTESLATMLECLGVRIYRKKIEIPYSTPYINQALYIETHFDVEQLYAIPMSYIVKDKGNKLLATDRSYLKENWGEFLRFYRDKDKEMCVYDTSIGHDKEWIDEYCNFFDVRV